MYHQNHQFQYPDFGQQTNRYDHPRPVREYRPGGGAGGGAPRANGLNNPTATFVNSNKSQYNGTNGPSSHPRYNNYASKYETVSDLVRNRQRVFFYFYYSIYLREKRERESQINPKTFLNLFPPFQFIGKFNKRGTCTFTKRKGKKSWQSIVYSNLG